jgi:cyclo(L-tyrosyl-L-tyrosyl) synthase
MHFFIPDVPSAYTLEALGYDPEKAAWKARRQCQYLHNKTYKALRDVGFTGVSASDMVLNWGVLSSNPRYLDLYNEVKTLFESDSSFQSACLEASNWVLERRVPEGENLTPEMLRSAARYLLAEIPLFLDTAGIVGKESSVFCYHQCVQFLDELFNERLAISPSISQGFVVIESQSTNRIMDLSGAPEMSAPVI